VIRREGSETKGGGEIPVRKCAEKKSAASEYDLETTAPGKVQKKEEVPPPTERKKAGAGDALILFQRKNRHYQAEVKLYLGKRKKEDRRHVSIKGTVRFKGRKGVYAPIAPDRG